MSEFPMVRYGSLFPEINAVFELPLLAEVTQVAGRAGRTETGGILIGEYFDNGRSVRIREITPMPSDSQFGRTWFKRGRKGLDALLKRRWREGQHYIGEWHSHPGGSAQPSGSDISTMRRIASDPLYRCASPVLLIVGGDPPDRYSISLTVFVEGYPHRLRYGAPSWSRPSCRSR